MIGHVDRVAVSVLPAAVGGPIDVFLCSASYEERCTSIASVLGPATEVRYPLVCHNQKAVPQVYKSVERLQQIFSGKATRVALDKSDPLRTADQIQGALSRVIDESRPQRYVVDITTFTHEALLILLRILQRQLTKRDTVHLVYATAAEYAVGMKPEEKWLSKGVQDVRSVLGYPGTVRPSRRSHLIVLVGFEGERAAELIDSYEPNVVSLGFGDEKSGTEMGHQAVNRLVFQTVASKVRSYKEFVFSTSDPFQAESAVRDQVQAEPDCNVLIAPMNTKISTVGVAGAAFSNDDIRLCYASAVQYNVGGYSRPGEHCYLMDMPFEFWRRRAKGTGSG